jgi:L-iditol 2-dehydrogenase
VLTLLVAREETKEALAARIVDATGGTRPDIGLECTGTEFSIGAAIEALRFSGTVFVVGVGQSEMQFPFMRFRYRLLSFWRRAFWAT